MNDARRPRILNVDDDEAGRYATSRVLADAGFEVVEAATGADALRLVADHPDLVLLDVNLPDIDGFEVCARIKADPVTAAIAVVHLSATAIDSEARSEGLEGGADAYLTQPVGARELVASLQATLRLRDVERRLQASELRFRGYFEQSLIAVAVTSPDKGWLDVNQAACDLLGYGREELGRLTWAELTHPDDLDADLAQFARVMAGESDGYRLEKRFIRKDGAVVDVDLSVHCERDADGHVEYFLALLSDVTERRRDESRQRATLDSMLDPHVLLAAVRDEAGVIVDFVHADANRAACDYMQMGQDELVGARLLDLLPGQAGSSVLALYAAAVESGEPLVLDDYAYPHDILAAERRYDIRGVRVGDALSLTWRDVTDRHAAAEAVAESEARLRAIIGGAREGISVLDLKTDRYTLFSAAQVAMTGFTLEEINKLSAEEIADRCHPDDRHISVAQQLLLADGFDELGTVEYRWRVKGGDYRWFRDSRRALRDEQGEPYALVGVGADITAAKEIEAALLESEDKFRYVFEGSVIGKALFQADGRVLSVNEALCRMLRRPRGEIEGHFMRDFMTPEDAAATESETMTLVAGDVDTTKRRTRFVMKEGYVRWADVSSSLRRDEAGSPLYFIASIVDVTDEVEAEEEIARLNVDLERRVAERTRELSLTNAELEEFVYSIAHDLRAPLRALAGFSEIVSDDYHDAIDATGRDYLGRIHAAAGHMGHVMDSLLALSRVNRGDLVLSDVDLSGIARGVVERLREEDPQNVVEFENEDGLVARADASLCEVLLQNLLGNAWKFSAGESPPRISFGAVTVGGRLAYCVADNGVGFEQQYAGRLFKPFERLHARDEFPGTGIGLATVRRVVARFGGECWAEGEVGKGAKVFFTLPGGEAGVA